MQHFQFYPDIRVKHLGGETIFLGFSFYPDIRAKCLGGGNRSQGPRAPRLLVLNILSTNMDSGAILILLGISKVTFQYLTLWVLFINIKYKIHNKIVFLGEFTQNFFLMMFYKKKYNHQPEHKQMIWQLFGFLSFWLSQEKVFYSITQKSKQWRAFNIFTLKEDTFQSYYCEEDKRK